MIKIILFALKYAAWINCFIDSIAFGVKRYTNNWFYLKTISFIVNNF